MTPDNGQLEPSGSAEVNAAVWMVLAWLGGALVLLALLPSSPSDVSGQTASLTGVRLVGQPAERAAIRSPHAGTVDERDDMTELLAEERLLAAQAQMQSKFLMAPWPDGLVDLPVFSSDGVHLGFVRSIGLDANGSVHGLTVKLAALPAFENRSLLVPVDQMQARSGHVSLRLTARDAESAAMEADGSCTP